jgi:hypothetical protein
MGPRAGNLALGVGLLLGFAAFGGACRVEQADVDTWKGTVKGPGKMVAVILADKYELPLRSYAALALVDMERRDVDGIGELVSALQGLDASTRDQIVDGLVPGLLKLLENKEAPDANTQGPPPRQIRAKDAAVTLIQSASPSPDSRKALTEGVMRWYVADFDGRSLAGNYSAEQVVRLLGASAASTLVDALSAELPQQALIKLAELIGQLGDAPTKARTADKLIAIEAQMMGEPFLAWLRKQIADQLGKDGGDAARVDKAARLNRDRFIDDGVIPAMKFLADQPALTARLLAIAGSKDPALVDRRTRALQALEGKVREEHVDALMALALDPASPAPVQDYAFDRVADVRSPKVIPLLWPLVQDGSNQRRRWRAGELVLTLGGDSVLAEFFSKLPSEPSAGYEPEELEGYALRMGQMTPLPTAVASSQLSSPDWWDRVIALHFFERKGNEADAVNMSRLLGDDSAVKGKHWEAGTTVGKVAKQAVDGLRQRLGQAAQPHSG